MSDGSLSAWEALSLNDQMPKTWEPMTPEESRVLDVAIQEFAEKHGIELSEAADSGDGKPGIYVGGHCWCGGPVGPREPGDSRGLGCLENIMHEMEEKK